MQRSGFKCRKNRCHWHGPRGQGLQVGVAFICYQLKWLTSGFVPLFNHTTLGLPEPRRETLRQSTQWKINLMIHSCSPSTQDSLSKGIRRQEGTPPGRGNWLFTRRRWGRKECLVPRDSLIIPCSAVILKGQVRNTRGLRRAWLQTQIPEW